MKEYARFFGDNGLSSRLPEFKYNPSCRFAVVCHSRKETRAIAKPVEFAVSAPRWLLLLNSRTLPRWRRKGL